MTPTPPPQSQELVFAALCADGHVKALWSDGELVALSPGGAAFVHVPSPPCSLQTQQPQQAHDDRPASPAQPPAPPPPPPSQKPTRQLSDFALSRARPALAAALRFRNLHSDSPAYCAHLAALADAAGDAFALGYEVTRVYWPPTPAAAAAAGLVELLDRSRVAVRSACGAARLVLDAATRARFAVCYPLLLKRVSGSSGGGDADDNSSSNTSSSNAAAAHVHVWQTSVFSVRACPPRWAPALALAEAVAAGAGKGFAAALRLAAASGFDGGSNGSSAIDASSRAPSPAALELRPSDAVTELPRVIWPDYANSAPGAAAAEAAALEPCFDPNSWWLEPGAHLPPDASQLAVLWTPEAAFWLLPQGGCWSNGSGSGGEVEAVLHADDSLLATDGPATVRHALPGEPRPRVYAEGAVPDAVTSRSTGARVAVGAAAARALKLRAMRAAAAAAARRHCDGGAGAAATAPSLSSPSTTTTTSIPPSPLDAAASHELQEAALAAGVGRFFAYADGRVRAVFDDRTVLNLGPDRRLASLVLPDGARAAVAAANPVGAEGYVEAALEFAAWAFAAPAARAAALQARARVEAELASTARMAAICAYGARAALPAGAAAAPPAIINEARPPMPAASAAMESRGCGRFGGAADPAARAQLVEEMLARNAELLQRL